MAEYLFLSVFAWILLGGGFFVWGGLAFDRMLKCLYIVDRETWVKLGKPGGYFWFPPEVRGYAPAVGREVLVSTEARLRLLIAGDARFATAEGRAFSKSRYYSKVCLALALACFFLSISLALIFRA